MNRKILILYTELAGYTIACLKKFCEEHPGVTVHLVRWPVNQEAPFDFSFSEKIVVHERKAFDRRKLLELADSIQPDLVLCSGWIDKDYLQVCRKWRKKIPVVLIMDNKWQGSIRQRIAVAVSPFTIRKSYSHAWVPGSAQKEFALQLGFPEKNIRTGFYAADVELFHKVSITQHQEKEKKFPHLFIYAGRYYDFKGVREMWDAFIELKNEIQTDWELWCLGTGDVPPIQHDAIRHFGFVQPDRLPEIMKQTGVFILPSRIEPWGVAVHEFAAAGFPLLLSENVGAASSFLINERNGFLFRSENRTSIKEAMQKIISASDDELLKMGEKSTEIALKITPASWSATLYDLLESA